jgi:hypothetical protein
MQVAIIITDILSAMASTAMRTMNAENDFLSPIASRCAMKNAGFKVEY